RVQTVLDWLRRPAAERPRFVTLYFDVVDKRSHNQGFASPEKAAAIREVDGQVAQLRAGLAALGQPANLVIVSDHGMAPVPPANRIDPASVVDPAT
ncbi:alkaline phosphatase family protein, partial [Mycoplasmopsis bovis]|uniref:alkaline phosphatase family protein n=1 Tax=Mycoplasmopsis bovis TaxID=28903 RepID=UPI003D283A40